jgi:endosialidase-like protein
MADKYDLPNYVLSRVRYYDGQFLKDEDFIDEQKYHVDRRRRQQRLLHVAGVAEGLLVSAAGPATVKVTAGTAVDSLGRQILLDADRALAIDPTWSGTLALTVRFREKEDRPADSNSSVPGNTRFTQDPLFEIAATPAEHAVRLGTVVIPSAGAAVQANTDGRAYSGLNLPGPAGASRTLRAKGDAAPEWAELEGSLGVTRSLSVAQSLAVAGDGVVLGKLGVGTASPQVSLHVGGDARVQGDVTVDKGLKVTQNLSVNGNLGVGTNAPAAKLDVAGPVRANRYRGENALALNDFTAVNPTSNVYLYSPPNDRDAWIYLDSADTSRNWGIYHRQLDTPVRGLPGNAIGFVGGTASDLQAYVDLSNGNSFFNGNLGVGRQAAADKLEVAGAVRICTDVNPIRFTSAWSGFPDPITNGAEIANDTGTYKALMILGNRSAGLGRRVAVWDRLEVNGALQVTGNVGVGTATPAAKLQVVGGAIMPQSGNNAASGVYFPENPGGGGGDAAWIRHYARAGEQTVLELGIANDPDDNIALMASGGVGIGTNAPGAKLEVIGNAIVRGDINIHGKHAIRGNDAFLRLNEDGAFGSGVYTRYLLSSSSLNVGGVNNWGNPGGGNVWIAGEVNMYGSYLYVHGNGVAASLGGDGTSDVEVGSTNNGVRDIHAWNRAGYGWMNFHCRDCVEHSDLRSKRDVEGVSGALQQVLKLRTVSFRWKADQETAADAEATARDVPGEGKVLGGKVAVEGKALGNKAAGAKSIGFVAQEVREVLPGAVVENERGLGVTYSAITALLVEAVREQQQRIDELQAAVSRLQAAAGGRPATPEKA